MTLKTKHVTVVTVVIISSGATCPATGELWPVEHAGGVVDAIATDENAVFAGIGGTVTRLNTASPPSRSGWALLRGDGHVRDIAILGPGLTKVVAHLSRQTSAPVVRSSPRRNRENPHQGWP